jgi:outer membrane protein assembly factor BamE
VTRIALRYALLGLALAGCTTDPNRSGLLSPYRTDVPQGNYVTQEMLDQIKTGMSRDQVRYALGAPLLIQAFRADRWDYVFRYQHPNGRVDVRRVAIRFDADERVKAIEADPLPLRDDLSDPALPGIRKQPGRNS